MSGILLLQLLVNGAGVSASRLSYKLIEPPEWRDAQSSILEVSQMTLALRKSKGASPSQKFLRTAGTNQTSVFSDSLQATYTTDITFGDQTFTAIVDTGSSDTWVIGDNFTCVDPVAMVSVDPSECGFGPTYTESETFHQIPNQNFQTVYGDGEMLSGILGTEDVTLANINVAQQEIAVVDTAYYLGDGVASGLMGLAYPNLTQAYPGTDPSLNNPSLHNSIQYTPLFTNMYQQSGIAPVFSLAINRDNDTGGVLAFGGLPEGVSYNGEFVSAPIKLMQIRSQSSRGVSISYIYAFYAIEVQGITLSSSRPASEPGVVSSAEASASENIQPPPMTGSSTVESIRASGSLAGPEEPAMSEHPDLTSGEAELSTSGETGSSSTGASVEPWWRAKHRARARRQATPRPSSNGPGQPPQKGIVMIVDSGTTLMYVPDAIAEAINAAFDPPAEYDEDSEAYFVDCSATAPQVSVRINGTTFDIDPRDLILNNVTPADDAPADEVTPCGSGIAGAGSQGMYVLGDVFLKNVLAVFDVGAGEMRFAAR